MSEHLPQEEGRLMDEEVERKLAELEDVVARELPRAENRRPRVRLEQMRWLCKTLRAARARIAEQTAEIERLRAQLAEASEDGLRMEQRIAELSR